MADRNRVAPITTCGLRAPSARLPHWTEEGCDEKFCASFLRDTIPLGPQWGVRRELPRETLGYIGFGSRGR